MSRRFYGKNVKNLHNPAVLFIPLIIILSSNITHIPFLPFEDTNPTMTPLFNEVEVCYECNNDMNKNSLTKVSTSEDDTGSSSSSETYSSRPPLSIIISDNNVDVDNQLISPLSQAIISEEEENTVVATFDEYSSVRDVLHALAAQQGKTIEFSNDCTSPTSIATSVTSHSNASTIENTRSRYHPLSIVSGFLGEMETLVESLYYLTCGDPNDDVNSMYTYELERNQLLHDLDKFDRMNSFDTFGTIDTSMNVVASNNTNETNHIGTLETIQDVGKTNNNIDTFKADNQENKRKIGFEYPLVSTIKQVPRLSPTEKSDLFFSELELYQNKSDSLSYSWSESDYEDNNTKECESITSREIMFGKEVISPKTSALRQGRFSNCNTPSSRTNLPPMSPKSIIVNVPLSF